MPSADRSICLSLRLRETSSTVMVNTITSIRIVILSHSVLMVTVINLTLNRDCKAEDPDCQRLITGQTIVNQLTVPTLSFTVSKWFNSPILVHIHAQMKDLFPLATYPIPFSEIALRPIYISHAVYSIYKCTKAQRSNALTICSSQNTSVVMKALNCKSELKPITTERQFRNTWQVSTAGDAARLVDWKVPSAIWKELQHFHRAAKERISVSLVPHCTALPAQTQLLCSEEGQNYT